MQNYQVFISYKRDSDKSLAEKIYAKLDSTGYRTFIDLVSLQDVTRFPSRIRTAILSSEAFVLLLSKETCKSNWVKKEVEIAIDGAKRGNKFILPVITDGTPREFFEGFLSQFVSNNFNFAIEKEIITRLQVEGVYPASPKRRAISESANQLKSIPGDIRKLIDSCQDCPYLSECGNKRSYQCPSSKIIDALMAKLHFFNKPIFQKDLFEIQLALNKLDINHNQLSLLGLDGIIEFITNQINRKWQLKSEYLAVLLNKEGFNSLCELLIFHFKKSTLAIKRAVSRGKDISEKAYHSLFILWWLLRSDSSILTKSLLFRETKDAKQRLVKEVKSFLASYQQLPEDKAVRLKAINFRSVDWPEETDNVGTKSLCGYLSNYSWLLYDETTSATINDDNSVTETPSYYLHESDEDAFHNPRQQAGDLGLCRGIIEIDNPFIKADEEEENYYHLQQHWLQEVEDNEKGAPDSRADSDTDTFYYNGNGFVYDIVEDEYAANYLAPLAFFCNDLVVFLNNEEPLLNIKPEKINISDFSKPHFTQFVDQGIRYTVYNVTDYKRVAFKQVDNDFKNALDEFENRGIISDSIKSAASRGDLSAQVYLANMYLFKEKNFKKALTLYEDAAQAGVEFCLLRVAQCYELIGDYKHALWWYLLLEGTKKESEELKEYENISLRIGNCCRHLGIKPNEYFKRAGEKGQAALYLTSNYYEDEKNEQLSKALQHHLKRAGERLGRFDDLHQWHSYEDKYYEVKYYDEEEANRKYLESKVENEEEPVDSDSQYKLGLYELEDYISSDEFNNRALRRIKVAANNHNPDALCFMSQYFGLYKHDWQAEIRYMEKAIKALYPHPFPDLSKIE